MSMSHNLNTALNLAQSHNLPVFPAREQPHEYTDRQTGDRRTLDTKSPYTKNGLKDASTDTTQIKAWWGQYPKGTSIFDLFRDDEASASACSGYWNGLTAGFLCQVC